jgi:hypothetical protein
VHRTLRPHLTIEFQESGRTERRLGSASPGVHIHVRESSEAQTHQRECNLKEIMSRGMHHLPEGRTTSRQLESASHRFCRGRRLDRAAHRRVQLNDKDVGQIPHELAAGQLPDWNDITDRNPIYKIYWTRWIYLVVRDGVTGSQRTEEQKHRKQSFLGAR